MKTFIINFSHLDFQEKWEKKKMYSVLVTKATKLNKTSLNICICSITCEKQIVITA